MEQLFVSIQILARLPILFLRQEELLGFQMVVRLHFLDHANQIRGVCKVAVVQLEPHVVLVRVAIQVVNAIRIEERRTALDAVHFIALLKQEFRQVRAVLAGDAGD